MTTETVLSEFEKAATAQAEANETGDYQKGSKAYHRIARAIEVLKTTHQLPRLEKFLAHPSVGVQFWAARYLLPIEEEKALGVLRALAAQPGIHGLIAETTTSEWRKGNL